MKYLFILLITAPVFFAVIAQHEPDYNLDSPLRNANNVERDKYRHPAETLNLFKIKSDDDVLEILPGGGYYAEVLLPFVGERGTYVAAHYPASAEQSEYRLNSRLNFESMVSKKYGSYNYDIVDYNKLNLLDENSFGVVLTFRNLHGLIKAGQFEEQLAEYIRILRPGGRLGIVQHRGNSELSLLEGAKTGYLPQEKIIEAVQAAGFNLLESSEINSNALDTADHENGVWSLPPSLRGGDKDKEKYLAIGESDRMTLVFVKPIR